MSTGLRRSLKEQYSTYKSVIGVIWLETFYVDEHLSAVKTQSILHSYSNEYCSDY